MLPQGFATNQTWIQRRNLSDANAFFTALLDKPYRTQVVLSPHRELPPRACLSGCHAGASASLTPLSVHPQCMRTASPSRPTLAQRSGSSTKPRGCVRVRGMVAAPRQAMHAATPTSCAPCCLLVNHHPTTHTGHPPEDRLLQGHRLPDLPRRAWGDWFVVHQPAGRSLLQ